MIEWDVVGVHAYCRGVGKDAIAVGPVDVVRAPFVTEGGNALTFRVGLFVVIIQIYRSWRMFNIVRSKRHSIKIGSGGVQKSRGD